MVSRDSTGKAVRIVGTVADITNQKETENELRDAKKTAEKANIELANSLEVSEGLRIEAGLAKEEAEKFAKEAEEANKTKSQFLASMSHEIRTPMNAIIGMAELLWETELSEEQKKYVFIFKNASDNLLNLINNILDVSKIEAGELVLENSTFDPRMVFFQLLEMLSFRTKDKEVIIKSSVSPDTPMEIIGDSLRLQQILINLIGNAIKFTKKGEIAVSVKVKKLEGDNAELIFFVKDNGIGIPMDKQKKIFESFAQADSSTTRNFGGTGLGLTISKQLVELMGGQIWVESEEGKGSTFFFTALFGIDKGSKTVGKLEEKASKPQIAPIENMKPLKILLAEDNGDNRILFLAFLKKTPYTVELAENGQIAVDKFKTGKFNLVCMDIQMPMMDGYTATKEIRKWEKDQGLPPTPIVALTASALKEEEQKSLDSGCDKHLTKPIKKAKLLEAISEYHKNCT